MHPDIIIIGAGAAGLMAAYELTNAGKKVIILEARDRCGGRILTINDAPFTETVELGAEFIHGDLPITFALLKEAGIAAQPSAGEMWEHRDGHFRQGRAFMQGWDLLMEKLGALQEDITINSFLEKQFPGDVYNDLRQSVRGFVSGYDSADPDKASTFALRNEWMGEDDANQHRVRGGYGKLIAFMEAKVKQQGGEILFERVVKRVDWSRGNCSVQTAGGEQFYAPQLIIAIPLGVLKAGVDRQASIIINPAIAGFEQALQQIGFGSVIKVLLEFKNAFWKDDQTAKLAGRSPENLSFVLSDETIPVWWSQAPIKGHTLTGWLSGPPAALKKDLNEEELLELSLRSLANIFNRSRDELKAMLVASKVVNWTTDPFTLGSYDYDMVESASARKIVAEPVDDTLFFAGEYVYEGPAMGTVEAALTAGKSAAGRIIG